MSTPSTITADSPSDLSADLICLLAFCRTQFIPALMFVEPIRARWRWSDDGELTRHPGGALGEPGVLYTLGKLFTSAEYKKSAKMSQDWKNHWGEMIQDGIELGPELESLRQRGHLIVIRYQGYTFLGLPEYLRQIVWEVFAQSSEEDLSQVRVTLAVLILNALPDPFTEPLWRSVCHNYKDVITSTLIPILRSLPPSINQSLSVGSAVMFLAFHLTSFGFSLEVIPWLSHAGSEQPTEVQLFFRIQSILSSILNGTGATNMPIGTSYGRPQNAISRALIGFTIHQMLWRKSKHDLKAQYEAWSSWWKEEDMLKPSSMVDVARTLLSSETAIVDDVSSRLSCDVLGAIAVDLSRSYCLEISVGLLTRCVKQLDMASAIYPVLCAELIKNNTLLGRLDEAYDLGFEYLGYQSYSKYSHGSAYVKIATADACIALKHYPQASQLLEEVLSSRALQPYTETCCALRLNKVKRRTMEKGQVFDFAANLDRILPFFTRLNTKVQAEIAVEIEATAYHTRQGEERISPPLYDLVGRTLKLHAESQEPLPEHLTRLRGIYMAENLSSVRGLSQLTINSVTNRSDANLSVPPPPSISSSNLQLRDEDQADYILPDITSECKEAWNKRNILTFGTLEPFAQ